MNLPKVKPGKKPKFRLGLAEAKLGSAIHEATALPCESNDLVMELLRGVRLHFGHFVKDLKVSSMSSMSSMSVMALLLCERLLGC